MDGRDGPTPGGVRGPAKLGLCPWRVARQLRRAAAIGVVQVGNLLRVGNYRHRARVSDVILLALLGLQGAGWQKQCAESLCCGVLRCCCKVVSRTGEGISRASHESWRSLGWCGGAVSVCMWHFPRWSVRQCVASWASRASHGCISFCLGLALGACLNRALLCFLTPQGYELQARGGGALRQRWRPRRTA